MKKCPKCKISHNKPGTFCSRKCANSRTFSADAIKKKSDAQKSWWANLSEEEKQIETDRRMKKNPYNPKNYITTFLNLDFDDVKGYQSRRLRVILEQEGKCNKCGISEWEGIPITLEYEHKDGNNQNNTRNNVEALCPNCHSQTSTWRGRRGLGILQKRVNTYLDLLKTK